MNLAPLAVALALAFVHFLGEKFSEHIERFHIELLSFGAGLTLMHIKPGKYPVLVAGY